MKLKVTVNGIAYSVDVEVEEEQRKLGSIITGGGGGVSNTPAAPTTASVEGMSANAVVAPLAGSVFKILVNEGDEIEAGQVLLILEAMKMERRRAGWSASGRDQLKNVPLSYFFAQGDFCFYDAKSCGMIGRA